jgi:hypothetical protein
MFELAERRAQQSMLKTYWTPDIHQVQELILDCFENKMMM